MQQPNQKRLRVPIRFINAARPGQASGPWLGDATGPTAQGASSAVPQAAGEYADEGAAAPVHVLLVDDHMVMREGLLALLEGCENITVVGTCSNGREAVDCAASLRPDVILMDMMMPIMNGIEATRIIHRACPEIRIIGLSMYEREDMAERMIAAGAELYLTKSGPVEALLEAICGNTAV